MSDKELEKQLSEAGNKLLQPPSSIDELLLLLDVVESSLSKVEQSPGKSMHDALSPLMKALVSNDLLRHSDLDVKVAVASCISEITRITAPDAPYDDDKMKDVFQLIVSSFEDLHDQSSRSYGKRVLILETVAKVRSCVVMLDLECDRLIAEMFQHFLKAIREDHPENIFSSMATIMTLVLEESEEVPLELLSPLLGSVKKDNKEVIPIAKRLGEKVLANSAAKLKPYLKEAVESLHISLHEYDKIVASVLEGSLPAVDHITATVSKDLLAAESKLVDLPEAAQATQVDGGKVATASLDEAGQMAESDREEGCSENIHPAANRSPKSIASNGVSAENVGTAAESELLMNAGDHESADMQDAAKEPSKSESDDSRAGVSTKSESKSEQTAMIREQRTNSSINSAESSHQAPNDSEKETEKSPDHQKNQKRDDQSSASEDPAGELSNSFGKEPETTQQSAAKESESEAVSVAPSSPSQSLPNESAPKNSGQPNKESLNQEESVSKKGSEATSDMEVKQVRRPSKKALLEPSHKEDEGGSTSDAEAKKQKQSGKKIDKKHSSQGGSSVRDTEDVKRHGCGKATLEIVPPPGSPDNSAKHEDNEQEIPRTSTKGKRSSGKGREIVPPPKSPDSSAKHEDNEKEIPRTKAKGKRSSGKGREIVPPPESPDSSAKHEDNEKEMRRTKAKGKRSSSKSREIVPPPESPDNSAKHEDSELEISRTSAKGKRSSGKGREAMPPPESPDNSAKHEDNEEETPRTSAKRKHPSGKSKVTDYSKYDDSLIGAKIKVWWPLDEAFYEGVVKKFDSSKKKYTVLYNDGDKEKLDLMKERWEFVEDDLMSEGEQEASADAASERHKKKKPRSVEPSGKHEITSPKSKSKDTATKSGHKSKDDGKLKLNTKDGMSRSGGRTDDTTSSKTKGQLKKSSGKSVDDTEEASARSKDFGSSTPKSKSKKETPVKTANKSKQETVAIKSKNKTPQSNSSKSTSNGVEKLNSGLSKVKESGNQKEKATDSAKTPDRTKGKLASASKERESEPKSGKKRARGKS